MPDELPTPPDAELDPALAKQLNEQLAAMKFDTELSGLTNADFEKWMAEAPPAGLSAEQFEALVDAVAKRLAEREREKQ